MPNLIKLSGVTFSTFEKFNQPEVNIEEGLATYLSWWE